MKYRNQKAFTLIEMLVAISILLIAVVGPLSIVAGTIGTSNLAKEQITAHYLAQEAVELVRNVKDNNRLSGSSWLQNLSNCDSPNWCTIENYGSGGTISFPPSVSQCNPTSGCDKLYFHDSGGLKYLSHKSSGGTESKFKRVIRVIPSVVSGPLYPEEAKILVKISWTMQASFGIGNERSFQIEEQIYDW